MLSKIEKSGLRALHWVEHVGLALIAVATVIAIVQEVLYMVDLRAVRLADLLLLFIYLEVLAMVGAYLKSGALPVRMPLYIAMVALARYVVLDVKAMDDIRILTVAGGILLLALAVLLIRYGHVTYPYKGASMADEDLDR
ncbi:MAG: phosphate-starvation-inducible PsiE family protein [Alphaproteobacteria bacterium]|nr:phosphate-starvation-inducible PsiE family protein [Alphaproteobacteria bacterium]